MTIKIISLIFIIAFYPINFVILYPIFKKKKLTGAVKNYKSSLCRANNATRQRTRMLCVSNCHRNEKAIAVTPTVSFSITSSPSCYNVKARCLVYGCVRHYVYTHRVSHTSLPRNRRVNLDVGDASRHGMRRREHTTNVSLLPFLVPSSSFSLSFFVRHRSLALERHRIYSSGDFIYVEIPRATASSATDGAV